jgi:hypothetical protein
MQSLEISVDMRSELNSERARLDIEFFSTVDNSDLK